MPELPKRVRSIKTNWWHFKSALMNSLRRRPPLNADYSNTGIDMGALAMKGESGDLDNKGKLQPNM